MKIHTSAGGIVTCSVHRQWYVLVLKDMNGVWTFPKGIIEKGETREMSAKREIDEEVGIASVSKIASLPPITYFYKRNGLNRKTVYYFLFTTKMRIRPNPQKSEGIQKAKWVSMHDAMKLIGYKETNENLLEQTWRLLKHETYKN